MSKLQLFLISLQMALIIALCIVFIIWVKGEIKEQQQIIESMEIRLDKSLPMLQTAVEDNYIDIKNLEQEVYNVDYEYDL